VRPFRADAHHRLRRDHCTMGTYVPTLPALARHMAPSSHARLRLQRQCRMRRLLLVRASLRSSASTHLSRTCRRAGHCAQASVAGVRGSGHSASQRRNARRHLRPAHRHASRVRGARRMRRPLRHRSRALGRSAPLSLRSRSVHHLPAICSACRLPARDVPSDHVEPVRSSTSADGQQPRTGPRMQPPNGPAASPPARAASPRAIRRLRHAPRRCPALVLGTLANGRARASPRRGFSFRARTTQTKTSSRSYVSSTARQKRAGSAR